MIGAVGSGVAAAASAAPKAGGGGPIRTAMGRGELERGAGMEGKECLAGKTQAASSATMPPGVTWTGRRTGEWTSTRTQARLCTLCGSLGVFSGAKSAYAWLGRVHETGIPCSARCQLEHSAQIGFCLQSSVLGLGTALAVNPHKLLGVCGARFD